MTDNEEKPICVCKSCKTVILLENAMLLHWCDREVDSNSVFNLELLKDTVPSLDKKEPPLLCKNCTYVCDKCKVDGCSECIKTECCDCSIQICRKCSDVDDFMCDCFGKCYTCATDVSRGSGWPCSECGIWNCSDCKKREKNTCKECGPPPKLEKVDKPTTIEPIPLHCESCETIITLEKAIRCKFCNIDEDEDENEDSRSVDSWDGKIKHLFCKKCTLKCDACEERGCRECVEFVCCDCGYNMCIECRNNEIDCGCYGKCYSCGTDVNRGSEGWPCGECEKWYCRGCRQCDNSCKECGPESDSESDSEKEEQEL